MTAPALEITATTSSAVQIKIPGQVEPTGALVNYVTSQTNQPKAYANHLYVWKTTSNAVPWGTDSDGDTAIDSNSPVSTQQLKFKFAVQQGYIVGYAVAADANAVCSTVYIPGDTYNDPSTYVTNDTTLSINSFGNNYVQVKLGGLPNYSPSANGNWVGIWQSDHVPYSGDPLAKADVTLPSAGGLISVTGVSVLVGSVYSVGYFMASGKAGRTALAASATFNT